MTDSIEPSTIPSFKRNALTGLVEGITYLRRSDGRIDWSKMIRPEHIVFNSKLDAPQYGKSLKEIYGASSKDLNYGDLIAAGTEVDPKHVLVLLMGFIELAALRGYLSAHPRIAHVCSYPAEAAICSCECTIDWVSNEEEPDGFTSYGTADATMDNTGGWGYLSAMAGNRAFVRAVRQGLRIPILGFDEIAKKDTTIPESAAPQSSSFDSTPIGLLKKAAADNKTDTGQSNPLDFDKVRLAAIYHWDQLQLDAKHKPKMRDNPNLWTKWDDITSADCLTLIKAIKDKAKKQ